MAVSWRGTRDTLHNVYGSHKLGRYLQPQSFVFRDRIAVFMKHKHSNIGEKSRCI